MKEAAILPTVVSGYFFPEPVKIDPSASEFYGELLRGMAHKLNNSLAVIQGFSSLMTMGTSVSSSVKDNVTHVKQAAKSAALLNDRILLAAGCVRLSPQSLNLGEYVPMMDRELRQPCEAGGVSFQLNVGSGVPPVLVDSTRFKDVLLELLRNAAEAAQGALTGGGVALDILPSGQVAESEPGWVDVFVRNSGSTIPQEKLAEIFKPFESTKETEHLGIGLTTVRALCSQMGIRVGVKSANNTTTFWLSLPKA
jgi:signal transduction histidine kinase